MVAETLEPGAKVTHVARRNDVAANVLFTWRRKARISSSSLAPFVPVNVLEPAMDAPPTRVPAGRSKRGASGLIEIDLGGGRRLKVDSDVDADALTRVLDVLERR